MGPRWTAISLSLTFALTACAKPAAHPSVAAAVSPLEAIVERHAREATFSGTALVAREGEILLYDAYGLADRAWALPNRKDGRYPICSITKQLTAALVLQQIAQGRLRASETIADVFPEYRSLEAGSVTVEELLTYSSGLADPDALPPDAETPARVKDDEMPWFYRTVAPDFAAPRSAMDYLLRAPARGKRGAFHYNNTDYIVLTAMLEQVSGSSYGELLRTGIFEHEKMHDSGLLDETTVVPWLTPGFLHTKTGWARAPYTRFQSFSGAGAVYSTAMDLFRWSSALMGGATLEPKAMEPLLTAAKPGGFVTYGSFAYAHTLGGEPRAIVERQGAIGAYRTLLLMVPASKVVVILLGNTDAFDNSGSYQERGLGYELLREALSPKPPGTARP